MECKTKQSPKEFYSNTQFDGSPDTTARFRLVASNNHLVLRGLDDHGDGFVVTLDQLWSHQMQQEINDWLAGQ